MSLQQVHCIKNYVAWKKYYNIIKLRISCTFLHYYVSPVLSFMTFNDERDRTNVKGSFFLNDPTHHISFVIKSLIVKGENRNDSTVKLVTQTRDRNWSKISRDCKWKYIDSETKKTFQLMYVCVYRANWLVTDRVSAIRTTFRRKRRWMFAETRRVWKRRHVENIHHSLTLWI